jgi:hypothetical protein
VPDGMGYSVTLKDWADEVRSTLNSAATSHSHRTIPTLVRPRFARGDPPEPRIPCRSDVRSIANSPVTDSYSPLPLPIGRGSLVSRGRPTPETAGTNETRGLAEDVSSTQPGSPCRADRSIVPGILS